MSQNLRRNKVLIDLTINQYYKQLPESERDIRLPDINIAPMQIKKVEIFKSYDEHITEVTVEIDNLDPTVATYWAEGKYIARLKISPDEKGDSLSFENYFACYNMVREEVPPEFAVFASVPTVSAIVTLKSITRTRLEIENNFTFELGGKNGKGAAGFGKTPKQFLDQDLMNMYQRNYLDEANSTVMPWSTDFCNFTEQVHQVLSTPSNGYRMITENNLQALEYFFKHYPLFNTPYGWILDDFNTSGTALTTLRISDFAYWEKWMDYKNKDLSDMFNMEIPASPGAPDTAQFRTAAAVRYLSVEKMEHLSYHDWIRFYTRDGFPKIYALDVSSNKPIPMVSWNSIHRLSRVLTPEGNIKQIENPMYKEYYTFMTEKEIEESQLFLNMFQELSPVMEKYSFSNLHVGDVDLHTVVEFKVTDNDQLDSSGNRLSPKLMLDKLGMGYQVLHTYSRENLAPKEFKGVTTNHDGEPNQSQFTFTHTLRSEIVFLVVDKGDLTIESSGGEDAVKVAPIGSDGIYRNPLDYCIDEHGNVQSQFPEGTPGGTDGVGIPGNTSIADQGEAMFNRGFRYVWGGKTSAAAGIDCSGFTSLAVGRSGIRGYPHGTANQRPWCQKHATKISGVQNVKRGDILFFGWGNGRNFGHTGIAISNSQFIHSSGGRSGGVGAKKSSFATYHPPRGTEIYRLKGGN